MSHRFASINFVYINIVFNFVSNLYEAHIRSSVLSVGLNVRLLERIALTWGRVGIFGFVDLTNFWFCVSVFALKTFGFSVLVSCAVCEFSPI